jgi:hypothetical protein
VSARELSCPAGQVRWLCTGPEHFQAKHALGLDPGVDTGSPPGKCDHEKTTERILFLSELNLLRELRRA